MSLRARLMALILLATLVPALLLGLRFFQDSRVQIDRALHQLEQSATNVAESLDDRLQATGQLHYGLAHSRLLDVDDRAACSEHLAEVRAAHPQFTGIITVRADGQLHCDSLRSGRQLDLRDRGYFKRVVAGAQGLTLEPVFGRLTGNAVLQVVHPARHADGSLRFMLVASLNLKTFAEDQHRQLVAPDAQLALVDRQGTLLAWSGPGDPPVAPGSSLVDTPLWRLTQDHPQGGSGEVRSDDGMARVWAVATLPAAGIQVLLGRPHRALVADAGRRLRQDLLGLAGVAVALFIGVWVLAEWGIRRPVGRITSMVRGLGQGDLSVRIAGPFPRGELGGLMEQLNGTAAALHQQRKDIEDLGRQLRQAQKLEAVGTLAGGIAHDFNNIIGAILGNLALARQDLQAGRGADDSLEQIQRAAVRARDLVQRIQTFSRADVPSRSRQSLRRIVEEVLPLVQVAMPAGATLRAELEAAECPVWADSTQLHQVLLNLCTNAWQALQGQPGTVTVSLTTLAAGEAASERPPELARVPVARLTVSDTGCGIDARTRERIFEPYFSTKGGSGGTGLGLSVAHGIVAAHRGAIVVDSQPGRGSRFSVVLPLLAEVDPPTPATPAPPPRSARPARGSGQRIVYVDDDEVMRLMVERLLQRAGYAVEGHASGQSALERLRADPSCCELLVTDFNMPDLSGLDLARAASKLNPELPVILTTGHVADDLPEQAHRSGVRCIIGKQSLLDELAPAVQGVLNPVDPAA